MSAGASGGAAEPRVSVLMPVRDPAPRDLERALRSYARQAWPHRELCIADDASEDPEVRALLAAAAERPDVRLARLGPARGIAGATNAALALARGDYALFLDHDDELADRALYELVKRLAEVPDADLVYSDHDVVDAEGRRLEAVFKPDWSPELLLSYMYVGHLKLVRTALARELGGLDAALEGSADHDFLLRLAERTDRIEHVPKVLYHWRAAPGSMATSADAKRYALEAGRRAVDAAARRRDLAAGAEWPGWARRARLGIYRLRFEATADVPVTIVIPAIGGAPGLRDCVASLEERTAHRAWKLLIAESRERPVGDLGSGAPHRVVAAPGPPSLSALLDLGVRAADTEAVVLLTAHPLVAARDWLDELLGYGRLDGIGAVGAKLVDARGRILHAGTVLGLPGAAGDAFAGRPDLYSAMEEGCYAHVARNYSAVSAGCMLTRRSLFLEVGGFDAGSLPGALADTDYCLRLRRRGWRVVANPYAELVVPDGVWQRPEPTEDETRRFAERWSAWIARDPYYNPNLTRAASDFGPRTRRDEGPAGAPAPSGELDLLATCAAQERELLEFAGRVAALEGEPRLAPWLAAERLLERLRARLPAWRRRV